MFNLFKKKKIKEVNINKLTDSFDNIHQERIVNILREHGPLNRKLINWVIYEKFKNEYQFKRGCYSPVNMEINKELTLMKENKIISYNYQNDFYSLKDNHFPSENLKLKLDFVIKKHWAIFSKYELEDIM